MACILDELKKEITNRIAETKGNKSYKSKYKTALSKVSSLASLFNEVQKLEKQVIKEDSATPNQIDNTNDNNTTVLDTLPAYTKGQNTKTYAGIGSRETPHEVLQLMTKAAKWLEQKGYHLQTGKTFFNKEEGADKAFSDGTKNKTLFAPEAIKVDSKEWQVAKELHPNFNALTKNWDGDKSSDKGLGGAKLMARNTNQVFGKNLDKPVDFVLFYAKETSNPLRPKGGTGQAVEMARRKGIPTINMADKNWRSQLTQALKDAKTVEDKSTVKVASINDIRSGKIEGVNTLRQYNTNKHFGNPFGTKYGKGALIQTNIAEDGVVSEMYRDWIVKDIIPQEYKSKLSAKQLQDLKEQRDYIVHEITSGNLDGKTLLYFRDTGKMNHAKMLAEIVNDRKNIEFANNGTKQPETEEQIEDSQSSQTEAKSEGSGNEKAPIGQGTSKSEYTIKGGKVAVIPKAITKDSRKTLIREIQGIFKDISLDKVSNVGNHDIQSAVVFSPIEYKYSLGRGKVGVHKAKDIPAWVNDLARDTEKKLNRKEGYYNHVLINRFKNKGIGGHTDAEEIYTDTDGIVGAVAIYSIGNTKSEHIIGGEKFKASDSSLVEMSTGRLYHTVAPADGVRYSITFRHIPKSKLPNKSDTETIFKRINKERIKADTEMLKLMFPDKDINTIKKELQVKLDSFWRRIMTENEALKAMFPNQDINALKKELQIKLDSNEINGC